MFFGGFGSGNEGGNLVMAGDLALTVVSKVALEPEVLQLVETFLVAVKVVLVEGRVMVEL